MTSKRKANERSYDKYVDELCRYVASKESCYRTIEIGRAVVVHTCGEVDDSAYADFASSYVARLGRKGY